ncbi:Hsp20 family protein [Psychromonas ossibalaenae]|uniref:Hsp20 family protein n=1 Tax=Psychromonas ossibalaenae TaxID=444922 RepID=UPI000367278F|nr:Hsp20 family protein [Psychromonas ossibalaenae]
MKAIDFTPLYRNSIGFDRFADLLDNALSADTVTAGFPPYNIEAIDNQRYSIQLALAGFTREDLDISVEQGVLTVRGKKAQDEERCYLHQGIAHRAFERKFSLADYVEVTGADLSCGLLTIGLTKEIPEAMKPKSISINDRSNVIEHKSD